MLELSKERPILGDSPKAINLHDENVAIDYFDTFLIMIKKCSTYHGPLLMPMIVKVSK